MAIGFTGHIDTKYRADTTFDFDLSNSPRATRGDKFVSWENNWQQLGYVKVASIPFLSRSRLSPSAGRAAFSSLIPRVLRIPVATDLGTL